MAFTKIESRGLDAGHVGVMTAGGIVGVGFTMLNFIGAGNTFAVHDTRLDISIAGGGGGGATGNSGNEVFYENDTNVSSSYTITTGKNAMSAGPITLDASVVVTIPAGSVWTVV
tara:strand:- start:421 stop:762 length:342 start_codon:yes stop_codon:yes gene_type:complete